MAANAGETKVKLWEGICYPENMRDDWQDEIDDILQVPFAYAVHDIDHDQKSKQRKTHAHVIVVWGGNTTRKAIINVCSVTMADQAGLKLVSVPREINSRSVTMADQAGLKPVGADTPSEQGLSISKNCKICQVFLFLRPARSFFRSGSRISASVYSRPDGGMDPL